MYRIDFELFQNYREEKEGITISGIDMPSVPRIGESVVFHTKGEPVLGTVSDVTHYVTGDQDIVVAVHVNSGFAMAKELADPE